MKIATSLHRHVMKVAAAVVLLGASLLLLGRAQGEDILPTSIVYQGRLTGADGKPLDGTFEMRMRLFATADPGPAQEPVCHWTQFNVKVVKGIFRVVIGGEENGSGSCTNVQKTLAESGRLWLEIAVRENVDMPFDSLKPLLPLAATPRAHHAQFCEWAAFAETTPLDGAVYTIDQIDAKLTMYYDKQSVDALLALYHDAAMVDSLLQQKAAADHNHDQKYVPVGSETLVPSGAVMLFQLAQCPAGWSLVPEAAGRVPLGLMAGGSLGGTLGEPLSNLASRTINQVVAHSHLITPPEATTAAVADHQHKITPPPTASADGGEHSHGIDPPATGSTLVAGHSHLVDPPAVTSSAAGSHIHSVNPPATNSTTDGSHQHQVDPPATATSSGGSHGHGYLDIHWCEVDGSYGGGMAGSKSGTDHDNKGHQISRTTDSVSDHLHSVDVASFMSVSAGAHAHSVDIAPFNSDSNGDHSHISDTASFTSGEGGSHQHSTDISLFDSKSGGGHTHQVTVPAFDSQGAGSHQHQVTVPAFQSAAVGTAQVDVSMPYIQFLICRKN